MEPSQNSRSQGHASVVVDMASLYTKTRDFDLKRNLYAKLRYNAETLESVQAIIRLG